MSSPITYCKDRCDECNKVNWVCFGDISDFTLPDVSGFKCWGCGHAQLFNQEEELTEAELENMNLEEGEQIPR